MSLSQCILLVFLFCSLFDSQKVCGLSCMSCESYLVVFIFQSTFIQLSFLVRQLISDQYLSSMLVKFRQSIQKISDILVFCFIDCKLSRCSHCHYPDMHLLNQIVWFYFLFCKNAHVLQVVCLDLFSDSSACPFQTFLFVSMYVFICII